MDEITFDHNNEAYQEASHTLHDGPCLEIEWPENTGPGEYEQKWIAMKAPDESMFKVER